MIFKRMIRLAAGKTGIMLTAGSILLADGLSAQTTGSITLPKQQITVSELFREIERQTGNVVVVYADKIDESHQVDLPSASGTLDEILGHALAGMESEYRVDKGYITIGVHGPRSAKPAPATIPTVREGQTYRSTDINSLDARAQRRPELSAPTPAPASVTIVETPPGPVVVDDSDWSSHIVSLDSYSGGRPPRFALKANLLHGAGTLTPNLGVEFGLGYRTSLEVHAGLNPWRLESREDNRKLAHQFIRPEFRYWLCERFNGHFFGVHAFYGQYNVGSIDVPLLFEKEYRYDGSAYGAGVTYGYFLPFGKRWGMEFNIGVGYARLDYDRFDCTACERSSRRGAKTYFGPTRAGITLVFNIK